MFQDQAPTIALAAGWFDIGFALFHVAFWRLFGWPRTLQPSGRLNGAITQTLNLMLVYCFAAYGGALLWLAYGNGPAPRLLLLAGGGFWVLRAALQPLLFPMQNRASVAITVLFIVNAALHLLPAL